MRDLRHRDEGLRYEADDILGLGDKSAPGATVFHLIADLSGAAERGAPTVAALLRLCTGLQLVDDLADAPVDARAGNLTWPVKVALTSYPGLARDDGNGVRAAVWGSGVAAAGLRLAAEAFADARDQGVHAGAGVLAELAAVWHRRALQRLAAIPAMPAPAAEAPEG
jgi:hypothetical protein